MSDPFIIALTLSTVVCLTIGIGMAIIDHRHTSMMVRQEPMPHEPLRSPYRANYSAVSPEEIQAPADCDELIKSTEWKSVNRS